MVEVISETHPNHILVYIHPDGLHYRPVSDRCGTVDA